MRKLLLAFECRDYIVGSPRSLKPANVCFGCRVAVSLPTSPPHDDVAARLDGQVQADQKNGALKLQNGTEIREAWAIDGSILWAMFSSSSGVENQPGFG